MGSKGSKTKLSSKDMKMFKSKTGIQEEIKHTVNASINAWGRAI
jgi:hypothetical protein